MIQSPTIACLINWGLWVNQHPNSSMCFSSIEPYRRLYKMPGEYRPMRADESSAKFVDALMKRMIDLHEKIGIVTALHYVLEMPICKISELVGIDRKKVSAWIGLGTAMIDGAYIGIEVAA